MRKTILLEKIKTMTDVAAKYSQGEKKLWKIQMEQTRTVSIAY